MSIVKHIPNTITCLNLISGGISIIFAFKGEFQTAFLFMIAASVFDFCDGFAARLLHAYSDIGKELDSLCDVVSFGLAPSLILYNYMKGIIGIPQWLCYIPLIIAAFSALRLAKFNLDTRQSHSFIGLPTPACALMVGAMVSYAQSGSAINPTLQIPWFIPILSLVLSILLISETPMFSLKFTSFTWKENLKQYLFGIVIIIPAVVLTIVCQINWSGLIFYIFAFYIVWNIVWNMFSGNRSKKTV